MRVSLWIGGAAVVALGATTGLAQSGHREIPPDQCPLTGLNSHDQVSPPREPEFTLNQKKNRRAEPADADIDRTVALETMLAPGNDQGRFDEGKGAIITGWVVDVKQGGHPETANCGNLSEQLTDTHITVGLRPDAPETETIVVEVTPWWRQAMAPKEDWSTATLLEQIKHRRVTFRGWLMFDLDHVRQAVNTAPGNPTDWRKTVWEIHPITSMLVMP